MVSLFHYPVTLVSPPPRSLLKGWVWHYVLKTWPEVIWCVYVADLYQMLFMVLLTCKLKFIKYVAA